MNDLNTIKNLQQKAAKRELDNKLIELQKIPCIASRFQQAKLIENHRLWDMEENK